MTAEQIELFRKTGKVNRLDGSPLAVYNKAHAKVYLHMGGISPNYTIPFSDGKNFLLLKNEVKKEYHEELMRGVFSTFGLSRSSVLETVKFMYNPTAGGYILELMKESRSSIFQEGQYMMRTNSDIVNSFLGIGKESQRNYKLVEGSQTNFDDFAKQSLLSFIVSDPNGLFSAIPIRGQSGKIEKIIPCLVPSSNRITPTAFYYDKWLVWEGTAVVENSLYNVTNVYDRSTGVTENFLLTGLSVVCGGVPVEKNGFSYFDTIINFILPFATKYEQANLMKDFMDVYLAPVKVTYESIECETCNGSKEVRDGDGYTECKSCGGTGIHQNSPKFGDIAIRQSVEKIKAAGDSVYEFTGGEPIRSMEYYAQQAENRQKELRYQTFSKDSTGANESGDAKKMDAERRYKFIDDLKNLFFDIVETHLTILVKLLTDGSPSLVIQRPTQNELQSSFERVENYKANAVASLPPLILNNSFLTAVRSSGDELAYEMALFLVKYDPFAAQLPSEKQKIDTLSTNPVTKRFIERSTYAVFALEKALRKNPDLFIGDYTMIEKAVDTELDILLNSQV
jgi:hypothetical protein